MIADVAHVLNTPIPVLMEMDLSELALWHVEALRLSKTRG